MFYDLISIISLLPTHKIEGNVLMEFRDLQIGDLFLAIHNLPNYHLGDEVTSIPIKIIDTLIAYKKRTDEIYGANTSRVTVENIGINFPPNTSVIKLI